MEGEGNKMLTTIPFSGFYQSWHSQAMDDELEQMVSDSSGCHPISERLANDIWNGIDWHDAMNAYAKVYADFFASWIEGEFGVKLEYESMSSPREYNFTTDRIFCHITLKDVKKLRDAVKPELLAKAAKQRFTSYDGFISHYPSDVEEWGDIESWDHNQIGTIVVAAVAQLDNEDWEYHIISEMTCNGYVNNLVYDSLNDKGKRISDIAYYLRRREERKWRTA